MINVPTATVAIAQAPECLSTLAIGSCIAVCLYSSSTKTGALAHFMLPIAGQSVPNPALYADTAINMVLEKLVESGVKPNSLSAKIVGGAQMFPTTAQIHQTSIGERNVEAAVRLLQAIGIQIAASSTGGNRGKSLVFDLTDGSVKINEAFAPAPYSI